VDRRATGSISNVEPVSEELREQFDICGLAAACAGSGKFKERLQQLQILDLRLRKFRAIDLRQAEEVVPVLAFSLTKRCLRSHVDRLLAGVAFALHRADFDAHSATGAVFGSDLKRVPLLLHALPLGLGPFEGSRGLVAEFGRVDLGANNSVRANHHALAALNAEILVPDRNELRDI